jgi:hypothetical protein
MFELPFSLIFLETSCGWSPLRVLNLAVDILFMTDIVLPPPTPHPSWSASPPPGFIRMRAAFSLRVVHACATRGCSRSSSAHAPAQVFDHRLATG